MRLEGADEYGLPRIRGEGITVGEPTPSLLLAGGFIFARAELFREVPYDPAIGFYAEEIGFSARAFTHGWDAFAPHRCVLHHFYERKGVARHWDDAAHAAAMESYSKRRLQHLLEVAPSSDPHVTIEAGPGERLGMGLVRSLAQYEARARLSWRTR